MKNVINIALTSVSAASIKETITAAIVEALKTTAIKTGKLIINVTIAGSYYICLTIAIGGVFAYISGYRKAGKYVTGSTVLFFILQALKLFI